MPTEKLDCKKPYTSLLKLPGCHMLYDNFRIAFLPSAPRNFENLVAHVQSLDVVHLSVTHNYLVALTTQAQVNCYEFARGEWVLRNFEDAGFN